MTTMNNLLQKCFNLLNQGEYSQLADISRENQTTHPSFRLLMAVAKGKLADYAESHELFGSLHKDYPENPDILYNQGLIFKQQGKLNCAKERFEETLLIQPNYHQAFHALANIQLDTGCLELAKDNFITAMNLQPNHPEYIRSVSKTLLSLGHYDKCFSTIEKLALSGAGCEDDMLLALESLYQAKAHDTATKLYEQAIKRYENNADFLLIAGLIEIDKKRIALALRLLEKAADKASKPVSFDIEANVIMCRFLLVHDTLELVALDKLINENSLEEHYQFISNLYETLGDVPKALLWVDKGLESFPHSKKLILLKAKCCIRLSNFDQAESLLIDMKNCSDEWGAAVCFEQIKLFEAKLDYQRAADFILLANELSQRGENKEASKSFLHSFGNYKIPKMREGVQQSTNTQKFVFIVGFPRSGTTLLESHFARLDSTVVLEETHALRDFFNYIQELSKGMNIIAYLEQLGVNDINRLADIYLNSLQQYVAFSDQDLIVDKMPLNGLYLSVVNKLFPYAKVIWVRRDPRDVCISCLKQPMVNLNTVEQFIESYDSYFDYLDEIQNKLKIDWTNVRYEDLVVNFDIEFQSLLSDLKITRVYGAKKAMLFNTPSYAQVTESVYTTSVNSYQYYQSRFDFSHRLFRKWLQKLDYC